MKAKDKIDFYGVLGYLDSIPAINCGGCGIAALTMYRWLKQRRYNPQIYYYYIFGGYYSQNEKRLNNVPNTKMSSCSHCIIKVQNKFYDSSGERKLPTYPYHILNEELLVESINNIKVWNSDFNRKYVKKISKYLNVDLSDIILKNEN